MPSPEMTETVELLWAQARERDGEPARSIAQRRADAEAMGALFPVADDVGVESIDVDGVPAEWLTPPGCCGDAALLYLHGGAYVAYSPATHRSLAARIARAAGVPALVPDYRLAPEHPHPAALTDARAARRWLVEDRALEPGRVALAGDSAGGGLSLALLVALRDAGEPQPAAAGLISPWTDLVATGESLEERRHRDPLLSPDTMPEDVARYAGGADPAEPLISPLYADLGDLAPLLIQVGTEEILYDDSLRLADRARAAGVEVTCTEAEAMFHVFQMIATAPEAREATDAMGAFLARALGN